MKLRYQECPWDFDNPPKGMAQLQKQIVIDEAEGIRKIILASPVVRARFLAEEV